MKLKRHFFASNDLADLERFEKKLEQADIVTPQIHVLTLDDTGAANHSQLHEVTPFMKTDVVHSTLLGAVVGIVMAALILLLAYLAGWHETRAGWLPFVYLSVIMLGFFTWQGGLWGIQNPNTRFREFEQLLREGKHLFFVDLEPGRGKIVRALAKKHPGIQSVGIGVGAPHWIVTWQHRLVHFFTETFP